MYIDRLLDTNMATFAPLLKNPRTLIYVCGLAGMQTGLFRVLGKHGLAEGYMHIKPELAEIDPATWDSDQIKRHIRASRRCMLEVY